MSYSMNVIKPPRQKKNHVSIHLINGLGDQLLDLIGFVMLCHYLNYTPQITFQTNHHFAWGNNNYDPRLFQFNHCLISKQPSPYYIKQSNPSVSLCPYQVYQFVSKFRPNLTFEKVSHDFMVYSKQIIKPSTIILSNIPKGIQHAYGIHLRKSDKIKTNGNLRHEMALNDFEIITHQLLKDVHTIIIRENNPTFLIVSEDPTWKQEISDRILSLAKDKPIQLLQINYHNPNHYSNYNSVLDMFCLSKCKAILQGVKYSTFSILASLLGNRTLKNYSHHLPNHDLCLIHNWSSVLSINNQPYQFNQHQHHRTSNHIQPLQTNIKKRFMFNSTIHKLVS
jgi:hypothetical protein